MRRTFTVWLLISWLACAAAGEDRRKVWEIDVAKVARLEGHGFDITGLRFSPDGRRLAVAITLHPPKAHPVGRLLVLGSSHPEDGALGFATDLAAEQYWPGPGPGFGWSPSGDMVVLGTTLIHFPDRTICQLPNGRSLFVSDDRLIASEFKDLTHDAQSTRMLVFDTKCSMIDAWDTQPRQFIDDVSAERGLLLVVSEPSWNEHRSLIVDFRTRSVIHSWGPEMAGGKFAEGGKSICVGRVANEPGRVPFSCWDTNTGIKIADAPTINGGGLDVPARDASRVIGDDIHVKREPFYAEYYGYIKRRVVWDFRSNKELVSWRPGERVHRDALTPNPPAPGTSQRTSPGYFVDAISPDGNYIAEAGVGGVLRLYRIEP
jgi:hypothetical protein